MAQFSARRSAAFGNPADLIEQLGAAMAARYADAEARMILRLAGLLSAGFDDPATLTDLRERARVYRELRLEGERIAEELRDPDFAARVLQVAANDGADAAIDSLRILPVSTTSGVTDTAARAVARISLELSNSLDDMSARIIRWMPDTYRDVVSRVVGSTILGADTARLAQRRAAEQLLARGVTGFTTKPDAAGKVRQWRIGTYAEMATRTAVNRAWQSANIAAAQSVGLNLVTIVIGVSACKVCAVHAGKIYSTDGSPAGTYLLPHATEDRAVRVDVAGTIEQARSQGWNHPNCRCTLATYFAGLSIPQGSVYDPEAEKARDDLRALERRVRDLKRQEAAAFDDVTKGRLRAKIRTQQGRIREHVASTGVARSNYREQLSFSDGRRP